MSTEQFARKIDEILKRLDALEATAHILYDKGTYVPTYVGGTTAGATTYSLQIGAWIRTGNKVTNAGLISWTAATGTGNARISTSHAAANVTNQDYSGSASLTSVTFANSTPTLELVFSNSFFQLRSPLTNAAGAIVQVEAAGTIIFTVVYFI